MNNQQTSPSQLEIAHGLSVLSPHKVVLGGDYQLAIEYYSGECNLSLTFANPVPARLEELSSSLHLSPVENGTRARLFCSHPGVEPEFGSFLALVIERIRKGEEPRNAIASQLEQWKVLTAGLVKVDRLGVTGLYGELWFARCLAMRDLGLDSWTALSGSVHDFTVGNLEIEVKTTTKPTHIHRISRPDQLVPSVGKETWLLSILAARVDITGGESIGNLISALIKCGWDSDRIHSHVEGLALGPIDKVLECAFTPREIPITVSGRMLPLVTPALIHEVIGPEAIRLSGFEYSIDVTGLDAPSPISDWLALGGLDD
jgi:hypothetical protein